MTRPKLLDLFCCQGGASAGYVAAGFDVVGVDIDPQPRYPYRFVQADALEYLAENVEGAPLHSPIMLCGEMFGLRTYRHRLFESDVQLTAPEHPAHVRKTTKMGRRVRDGENMHVVGNFAGVDLGRQVMEMPWASRDGLREAIPPAYTEHVGRQLLAHLGEVAA